MAITTQPQLTLEEFLKLLETEPASDFINREIIQKPMPQGEHSLLWSESCHVINQITEGQKNCLRFARTPLHLRRRFYRP